jgi:hypothetical protein
MIGRRKRHLGLKNEEVVGDSTNLHNEGLHDFVPLTKYYWGDQNKGDEIGGACGTQRGDEKYVVSWWRRRLK